MAMAPDVQRKAQQELDTVVGSDRPPNMEDIPSLPYIQVVLFEVARWMPAIPLSLPHAVTEDDVYKGFAIPAGSVVIGVSLSNTRCF